MIAKNEYFDGLFYESGGSVPVSEKATGLVLEAKMRLTST